MNVFISYSTSDINIVKRLVEHLKYIVNNVYYWNKNQQPGQDAWSSIYNWIERSDIVVAVVTDRTVSRAMSVGNEIGYAKKAAKIIIPLVSHKVKETDLGCLKGITYIRIDQHDMNPALNTIKKYIFSLKAKQKEDLQKTLLIIGGIILFMFLISKK